MKILRFTVLLILSAFYGQAQVGIGTENPNPKSVLDLKSQGNNQGLLVPRLTTAQRTATSFTSTLTTTEKGLLIFDTDTNKFYYWNGTAWTIIEDSTGTDSQTLSFNPVTGLLTITGGNNVNLSGAVPGGNAGGDLTGSYPNPAVANNTITSAKLIDGTIVNADISNTAAIAINKIAGGTNGQVLLTSGTTPTWSTLPPPSGAASGDLTGSYPNPTVTSNAITSAKIQDGSVTSADIADGTIANADIANLAVNDSKIAAGVAVNKLAGGTLNQVLTTTAGGTAWANSAAGTVTSVTAGTGLSGGTITTMGTISLSNTLVTPGTYGSLTQIPQVIVDTQGRITSASNLTVTGFAPNGVAGGDLTGTYPNPVVANNIITSTKILDGVIVNADINNTAGIVVSKIAGGTNGQVLLTTGTTPTWSAFPPPSGASGGDLTGTYPNPTVARIQARPVLNTTPTTNQVLKWNGAAWAPAADNNSAFVLPYFAALPDGGPLLSLDNTGSGPASQFVISNPSTKDYAIQASTAGGTGGASLFVATNAAGTGVAVEANTAGVGNAIFARSSNTGASAAVIQSNAVGTNPAIRGDGIGIGVWGLGGTAGVNAPAFGTIGQYLGSGIGYGVYGSSTAEGFAGIFVGRVTINGATTINNNLNVTGAVTKGSGTFKIDHPLDPTNKFLYHSFVESPDMKNIYDGVITLDANGEAEVLLPEYFEALNKDFRYQLTCVGGFANVYVSKEVSGNQFTIAGGRSNLKVSWQVTGIRKDAYAEKNRVQVEVEKSGEERGKYLYPAAYGAPESMGINKPIIMPDVDRLLKKQ